MGKADFHSIWKYKLGPVLGFALLSCGFFWFKAGEKSIWAKDIEGMRAEVVREMVTLGDWLIPHLNGEILVTKPPFYFWLAGFCSLLSGEVTEYTLSLPSVIGGFLGLVWTFLIGLQLFNYRIAWLSALILATSPLYILMSRSINLDMTLAWLTTATLGCFLLGFQSQGKSGSRYYLWAFVFMGLATMTKGPVGVMIPGIPILGYLGWRLIWKQEVAESKSEEDGKKQRVEESLLRKRPFTLCPWRTILIGIGIFLLITLPWAILVYFRVPNLGEILYLETLFRYARPNYQNAKPFYFYFIALLEALAPWSLFLPAGFLAIGEKYKAKSYPSTSLPSALVFLLLWIWPSFFIFSITSTKRDYYLLPLCPALALLVAWIWDNYLTGQASERQQKLFSFAILSIAGIFLLGPMGILIFVYLFFPDLVKIALVLCLIYAVLSSFLLILFLKSKNSKTHFLRFRGSLVFSVIILALAVGWGTWFTVGLPKMDSLRTRKEFFREVASRVGSHRLVNYRYNGYDLQFYVKRIVPIIQEPAQLYELLKSSDSVYIIMEDTHFNSLKLEGFKTILIRDRRDPINPQKVRRMVLISN
ncbi:MAG TPA: glycosyltransferase family 39 protein [Candidatus Limnocylindrales bacterium]|nr:glycosyltransferase family 39 protein [Candidatus Limnocylindrales bacterium]